VPFIESAPFTATGHLNVGDGFDFAGQGIVQITWCPLCPNSAIPNARYVFAVAEPPTLFLVVAALVPLGALFSPVSSRPLAPSIAAVRLQKSSPLSFNPATFFYTPSSF